MRYDRGGLYFKSKPHRDVRPSLSQIHSASIQPRLRTRTRHSVSPVLVTAANSVFRGLGAIESTSSLGRGSAGTLESCRAAEVGKYMTALVRGEVGDRREGTWDVARVARVWEGSVA